MAKYYVISSSKMFKPPDVRGKGPYVVTSASSLASAKRKLQKWKRDFPRTRFQIADSKLKPVKKRTAKKKRKRKRTTRRRTRTIWDLSW